MAMRGDAQAICSARVREWDFLKLNKSLRVDRFSKNHVGRWRDCRVDEDCLSYSSM